MATIYRTSDGDILDLICYKFYGTENMAAVVLSANPNLSEFGPILRSNIEILLPELQVKSAETVSLWD